MRKNIIIILISLFLFSSCFIKNNLIQCVCDEENAIQQAILHYKKLKIENHNFVVNKISEDNRFFFIRIEIDNKIEENIEIEENNVRITIVLGGSVDYKISKKNCKIKKIVYRGSE